MSATDAGGHGGLVERTAIRLLGGFAVRHRGQDLALSGDGRRLVAFLALRTGRVPRAFVAGNLWLEGSQERAFANLRSTLWRVRSHAADLISADSEAVSLSDDVDIDVRIACGVASQLFSDSCTPTCDPSVIDLFTEELLPGWYDDFVLLERESLRQQALHALETMADRLCDAESHGAAMHAAMASVRLDRLRESAHRIVIRIHVAEGNYSEARRHHEEYADLLQDELGLAPSPSFARLLEQLPAVSSDDHPLRFSRARRSRILVASRPS